jgi:hypothetical protein
VETEYNIKREDPYSEQLTMCLVDPLLMELLSKTKKAIMLNKTPIPCVMELAISSLIV